MSVKTYSRFGFASMFGVLLLAGCGLLRPAPDVIAERFWDASLDGDYERAEEYVTVSSRGLLEDNADNVPKFQDIDLGESEIDGDEAKVHTAMTAMINDQETEIEFDTILEREDGQWRVDLRKTSGQVIAQFIGGAAGEFMGQIGEAMGESMRGMLDGLMKGLAEGMEQAGQSLRDSVPDSSR